MSSRSRRYAYLRRGYRRRLTRNQKFAGPAVAAGLLLALAHGHTPPTAATASAPAAIAGCGGSNEALANCMAAAAPYGWTGGQTTCLDWLWTRESNFETGATNPQSGAYGMPAASLPADTDGRPPAAAWQTSPATQIGGASATSRGTYGTPVRRLEPRAGRRLVLTRASPACHPRPGPPRSWHHPGQAGEICPELPPKEAPK